VIVRADPFPPGDLPTAIQAIELPVRNFTTIAAAQVPETSTFTANVTDALFLCSHALLSAILGYNTVHSPGKRMLEKG
jgi:hypothetical protein